MNEKHLAVYKVTEELNKKAGFDALSVEYFPGKFFRILYSRVPILYDYEIRYDPYVTIETSIEFALYSKLKECHFNPLSFQAETKELLSYLDEFVTAMRIRLIEKDAQGFSNWKLHDDDTAATRIEIRADKLRKGNHRSLEGAANWAFIAFVNHKIKNNGRQSESEDNSNS